MSNSASLRRAEEDFRNWRTANPQNFASPGFLTLSAVLAGAQRNYDNALAA